MYIGEDVERTVKYKDPNNNNSHQLGAKMNLHQQLPRVKGTVLWYAKAAVDNIGNYGTALRQHYWRVPALQPIMKHIDHKAPKKPRKAKAIDMGNGQHVLFWLQPRGKGWKDEPVKYAVYRFEKGEKTDIDNPSHMIAITPYTFYELPKNATKSGIYVVTALDRMQNESKGVKMRIK